MQDFHPFAGESIVVVGLGQAGLPSALRLQGWGAKVSCWDDKPEARAAAEAAGLAVENPAEGAWRWDALLLSPGIPHIRPRVHPAAAAARAAGAPILTDADYLYRAVRAAGSKARFVGITGTNGKSTTTALIQHILAEAGVPALAGGNLGPAAMSLDLLGDDGVYVLEMSSYMLERVASLHCNVAIMLNLSPDHLDRHGDMVGYAEAKRQIFARQTAQDVAILGQDDAETRALAKGLAARLVPISAATPQPNGFWAEGRVLRDTTGPICDLSAARALPGQHNAQNAAAAAAACLELGLSRAAVAAGILSYPGLPHRLELVGTIGGVRFINDSKGTNADSSARALDSYAHVVWIAGGVPKAGGITSLTPWFPRVAQAYLIGQAAEDFAATLAAHGVAHEISVTLEVATAAAARFAADHGVPVVLLSPACASFDQFSGFPARGDRFRDLVAGLQTPDGKAA